MMKILFYPPKSGHVIKFITFTDLLGKFQAVLPLASAFCCELYIFQIIFGIVSDKKVHATFEILLKVCIKK